MSIKKVTSHPTQNEELIFDRSQTGRIGYRLPKLDVEETNIDEILPLELRRDDDLSGVPEVSEVDVIRHFTRMSTWNFSIDLGMYPLGSCTMKYNSRLNEKVARIGGLPLSWHYSDFPNDFLVCVTETNTKEQINNLVTSLKSVG